ncbi:mCG144813, partial [Mus musculus]
LANHFWSHYFPGARLTDRCHPAWSFRGYWKFELRPPCLYITLLPPSIPSVWSLNVFCGVWTSRELQRFTHQAFSQYEDTVHYVWKARQQEHEGAVHTASAVRKPRESRECWSSATSLLFPLVQHKIPAHEMLPLMFGFMGSSTHLILALEG